MKHLSNNNFNDNSLVNVPDGVNAKDAVNKQQLDSHTTNTSNPHDVTKAQVGLGNVDNTSDADKPISDDTQAALDTKADLDTLNSIGKLGSPSTAVNIYVSAATGNDSTGDGSSSAPYLTIQKAFNSIPKVINQDYYVNIEAGTYNEEARLQGITGSAVVVQKWGTAPTNATTSTGVLVKALGFYDINGRIVCQHITSTSASTVAQRAILLFSRVNYATVSLNNLASNAKSNTPAIPSIEWDGSGGSANSNHFSNQQTCLYIRNGSRIRIDSTNSHSGTASNYGVWVAAAEAFWNGSNTWTASATTPIKAEYSGDIRKTVKQSGFIYVQGNGTNALTVGLTFPQAFNTAPASYQLTFIGAKATSGGVPTSISDFSTDWASFSHVRGVGFSETGGTVRLVASANHSSSYYFGVAWTAEGEI